MSTENFHGAVQTSDGRVMGFDYETYCDLDIVEVGSFRYIEHPSFEVLLLAYSFELVPEDQVKQVDFTAGETWPQDFLDALHDAACVKTAWNCAFERDVTRKALGEYQEPMQYEDTMILSAQCGLPLTLKGASEALALGEDSAKMKEGKALIRYFCKPCRPTKTNGQRTRNMPSDAPEKWELFKKYNRMDVVAERTIREMLIQWRPIEREHEFWALDAKINEKGVRIDRTFAEQAVAMSDRLTKSLTEQAIEISGLENPNSTAQVKEWLGEQEGKEFPSLNKKVVADVVASLESEKSRKFMAIRTELSKTSVKKYNAMLVAQCEDETVKGCFQFYGANRTGRFAGRHVQFQNLPQNHMPDLDEARALVRSGDYETVECLYDGVSKTLSELIRTAIIPNDGDQLLVSDYSAIEARVISWFAGDEKTLDVFRNNGDVYCTTASAMFKVPVVKHGINGELRQKGKAATLGCGYGGGVTALENIGAKRMGLTEEEMQEVVDLWRSTHPEITAMWRNLERDAIRCVAHNETVRTKYQGVTFAMEKGVLWMSLPSGRRIAYFGARYDYSKWNPDRKVLSYMGIGQQKKNWTRLETWGGKITENLVQATARDCLRESMLALDKAGYDIRAHVHDEVIVTEPLNGRSVEEMSELMSQPISWAPGLPLRADGYCCPYYQKD